MERAHGARGQRDRISRGEMKRGGGRGGEIRQEIRHGEVGKNGARQTVGQGVDVLLSRAFFFSKFFSCTFPCPPSFFLRAVSGLSTRNIIFYYSFSFFVYLYFSWQLGKEQLLDALRFGAEMVFRSKDTSITDADIDAIMAHGKASGVSRPKHQYFFFCRSIPHCPSFILPDR